MRRVLIILSAVVVSTATGCAECCNFLCPGPACCTQPAACPPANPYETYSPEAAYGAAPLQPGAPYIAPSPN